MGLTFGSGESQGRAGSSVKMADGVFIDKGLIKEAKILYNAKRYDGWKPNDVALALKLHVEGLSFDKELWIAGDFRREGTPQGAQVVVGAGGAFRVLRVFDELGIIGEVDDTGRFTESQRIVDALLGRELFFLQYAAYEKEGGKTGYRDYEIVAAHQEGETEDDVRNRLYEAWLADTYVQGKFRADLAKGGQTSGDDSFDYGANVGDNFGAAADDFGSGLDEELTGATSIFG